MLETRITILRFKKRKVGLKFPPPALFRSSLGVGCVLLSLFAATSLLCAQPWEGYSLRKAIGKLQRDRTLGIAS